MCPAILLCDMKISKEMVCGEKAEFVCDKCDKDICKKHMSRITIMKHFESATSGKIYILCKECESKLNKVLPSGTNKYQSYCYKCDKGRNKRENTPFGNCNGCYQNKKTDSIPTHFWNKDWKNINNERNKEKCPDCPIQDVKIPEDCQYCNHL